MFHFKSPRERKLWYWTAVAVIVIYASLGLAQTLSEILRSRGLLTLGFWIGIALVGLTIIIHGLKTKPGKAEIVVWVGIAAVYFLVFLRMHTPEERSHLIEYSVVAIFIHEALKERNAYGGEVKHPALWAILATIAIGFIDECIQLVLPNRVFDWFDVLFDSIAAVMTIGGSMLLGWVRRLVS